MEKIKISNLSIGDWVKCLDEPMQVYWIEGDSVGLGAKNIIIYSCNVAEVKPIPLTPEILEKNGFVKNGEYNEWNIGTWRTPYLLGVSLERPAITIKWNGSSLFIDQAKYVHQLQQALRLAGVEKEIEV